MVRVRRVTRFDRGVPGRWIDESGQFFFHEIHSASPSEGVQEAFGGCVKIIQAERGGTVQAGGANEVGFGALNSGQLPGALREAESRFWKSEPEKTFGEKTIELTFTLLVLPSGKES